MFVGLATPQLGIGLLHPSVGLCLGSVGTHVHIWNVAFGAVHNMLELCSGTQALGGKIDSENQNAWKDTCYSNIRSDIGFESNGF